MPKNRQPPEIAFKRPLASFLVYLYKHPTLYRRKACSPLRMRKRVTGGNMNPQTLPRRSAEWRYTGALCLRSNDGAPGIMTAAISGRVEPGGDSFGIRPANDRAAARRGAPTRSAAAPENCRKNNPEPYGPGLFLCRFSDFPPMREPRKSMTSYARTLKVDKLAGVVIVDAHTGVAIVDKHARESR